MKPMIKETLDDSSIFLMLFTVATWVVIEVSLVLVAVLESLGTKANFCVILPLPCINCAITLLQNPKAMIIWFIPLTTV